MVQISSDAILSLDATISISRQQVLQLLESRFLEHRFREEHVISTPVDCGGPAPSLRLFEPAHNPTQPRSGAPKTAPPSTCEAEQLACEASGTAHRIINPGVTPSLFFQQLAEEHTSGPQPLSQEQLTQTRESLSLNDFYQEHMSAWREQQLSAGDVKAGTLSKERQALNRWQKWELSHPPENWPAATPWKGCPLGYLVGGYLDRFYRWMASSYAKQTVVSTRNHLRTILNFAQQLGVWQQAPQPKPLDLDDPDDLDEDLATVWTETELDSVYRAMEGHFDLQAAFVLAVNCGPRTVDLFTLRWEKNLRLDDEIPMLRFRARKSKKKHGLPLHDVVVQHLKKLQRDYLWEPNGPVFPNLGSVACKDPERSRAARRRNKLMKKVLSQALGDHDGVAGDLAQRSQEPRSQQVSKANGTTPPKPWQVCRSTCCTRLNNVEKGIGSWAIGQGSDRAGTKLAEDFYYNPSELAQQAMLGIQQPPSFYL